MICSSVYFFAFTGALLMTFYHTGTLRATGLVFGGKVKHVTAPKQHGGGSVSQFVYGQLKNQLFVSTKEFDDLYRCPMGGNDYATKIRSLPNIV
jgi:hypothetical protein